MQFGYHHFLAAHLVIHLREEYHIILYCYVIYAKWL